jgi:hypothetical protein
MVATNRFVTSSLMRTTNALLGTAALVGTFAWIVLSERPREAPLRLEVEHTMKGNPGSRMVSERSEFMRSER